MPQVKTIYVLRHGKASPGDAAMEDHDRPLMPRGEMAAQLVGNYMKWKGYFPDHAVCSTALRTRQTLELLLESLSSSVPPSTPSLYSTPSLTLPLKGEGKESKLLFSSGPASGATHLSPPPLGGGLGRGWDAVKGHEPAVEFTKKLYLASAGDIFHIVQKLPAPTKNVLVVGHNPGLHQFCLKLCDEGDEDKMDTLALKFPTCALAVIKLAISDWAALSPHGGILHDFVLPKAL